MNRIDRGWLLLLCAGVAFAVAAGAGSPGVAAPAWSLAGLAACAVLVPVMRFGSAVSVAAAALSGGLASAVLVAPGFPLAHDLSLHVWTLESFGRGVAAGDWNPRFHLAVGLGTPLGLFYPPLPFWFGVPFYALDLPPAEIAKGALVALHVACAASMAAAVAWAGRGSVAALASGLVYALAPYLLFDLHGRGAVGEAAAAIFLPWLIAGADRSLRGAGGLAGLAFAGVGLAHAHALTLVMLAGALPLIAIAVVTLARGDRSALARRGLAAAAALALALATAAHWLVPALLEADSVSIATVAAGAPDARYADFAPAPTDLLERRSVDDFVGSLTQTLRARGVSEMPYYFGVGLLLAACAGARGARARPGDLVAASMLGVGLALCLDPLASLWGRIEPLARMQFPWRHMLLATPAAAWLAGSWIASAATRSRSIAGVAGAVLLLDAYPYLGIPIWVGAPEEIVFDAAAMAPQGGTTHAPLRWDERPLRCEGLLLPPADRRLSVWRAHPAYPEYLPPALLIAYRAAASQGDPDASARAGVACIASQSGVRVVEAAPLVESRTNPRNAISMRVEDGGDTQRFEFAVPVQGSLRLRIAAFPGFVARDGEDREIAVSTCDGWLCLDLPAPTRHVTLSFGTTPARRVGAWLSAGAVVALSIVGVARRRAR